MEIFVVVVILIVAAVLAYVVFVRKRAAPPELEAPPERKLPAAAPPAVGPAQPARGALPAAAPPAAAPKAPAQPPAGPPWQERHAQPPPQPAQRAPEPSPAPPAAAKVEADDEAPSEPGRPAPSPARAVPATPAAPARKTDVAGLRKGLDKVRAKEGFFGRLRSLFGGRRELDPAIVERIEEVLLGSDVGMKTTEMLLADLRTALDRNELADNDRVWEALRAHAARILALGEGGLTLRARPTVVMVVGVNGAGKTTTIGKLATKLKAEGKTVVLAAGDTFRAAAVQQLGVWAKRVGCEVVSGKDGANPGAVIFDAIQKAKEIGADFVLADTAGRLHTKTNLMEELKRVERTMAKAMDGAPHETLLVLDATNGQNAMQQAAMFKEALRISGIVLTKLDGTAKGGVILGICAEHGIPVRYVGLGERAEDLREFNAEEFVEAMLGQSDDPTEAAA